MRYSVSRRDFLGAAGAVAASAALPSPATAFPAPAVHLGGTTRPAAVSSANGLRAVTRATELKARGTDTLDVSPGTPMVARPTGTINLNVVNAKGEIRSVTTTSGLAWKIPGRVGDSPIVGAGQYTDNDVGAAARPAAARPSSQLAAASSPWSTCGGA